MSGLVPWSATGSHTAPPRSVLWVVTLPPFQALLDAHGRDVHRFLLATAGPGAAEDCFQETWLAALRAYPRLREASNLRGWLLTIAQRKAIDHVRIAKRIPMPVAAVPERAAPSPPGLPDEPLWERVRELPPKQRTAVALRYVADASYTEIAEVMATSQEAARRNVHEGLRQLRRELEP